MWSVLQDSNLRPSAPKADALPDCAKHGFNLHTRNSTFINGLRPRVVFTSPNPYGKYQFQRLWAFPSLILFFGPRHSQDKS